MHLNEHERPVEHTIQNLDSTGLKAIHSSSRESTMDHLKLPH